jgi:SAM-dependent methyltransferase
LERLERDWQELAALDPLWAILADESRRHGRWAIDEFFAAGETEIAAVLARAEGLGLPAHRRRALDFGCGVGRLTAALARHFDEAVGVDISETMIRRAEELNADKRCSFITNVHPDLSLFADATFDLVYTRIVLQHLPRQSLVERYIEEFVRVLSPGGLAVFQIPDRIPLRSRLQPRRRLFHVLRAFGISADTRYSRLGLHPMQMLGLPEQRVESVITRAGGMLVARDARHIAGADIDDRTYFVTRRD